MRKNIAFAGALAASSMLAASGAVAFAAPLPEAAPFEAPAVADKSADSQQASGNLTTVRGIFTFDQDKTLSSGQIRSVFASAVNALCAPTLEARHYEGARSIDVLVEGAQTMKATVEGMSRQGDNGVFIMGCACASNPAGGGAAVNAEVQGVSVGEVVSLAYAS